jgi:hypothetical protein
MHHWLDGAHGTIMHQVYVDEYRCMHNDVWCMMQYTYYWLMSGVNCGTISVLMMGKEPQPCILETPRILECTAVYLTIAVSLSHYKIQYSWFLYKPGVKKRNLIVFCLSNVGPHAKFFCIFPTLFHIRLIHRISNTIPYKAHTPHFRHYSI